MMMMVMMMTTMLLREVRWKVDDGILAAEILRAPALLTSALRS